MVQSTSKVVDHVTRDETDFIWGVEDVCYRKGVVSSARIGLFLNSISVAVEKITPSDLEITEMLPSPFSF